MGIVKFKGMKNIISYDEFLKVPNEVYAVVDLSEIFFIQLLENTIIRIRIKVSHRSGRL